MSDHIVVNYLCDKLLGDMENVQYKPTYIYSMGIILDMVKSNMINLNYKNSDYELSIYHKLLNIIHLYQYKTGSSFNNEIINPFEMMLKELSEMIMPPRMKQQTENNYLRDPKKVNIQSHYMQYNEPPNNSFYMNQNSPQNQDLYSELFNTPKVSPIHQLNIESDLNPKAKTFSFDPLTKY